MRTLSSASLLGYGQVQGNEPILISEKDLKRLTVISKFLDGLLQMNEVVQILSLSPRQIKRLLKRVKDNGKAGIIHKARGRPSNRRLPEEIKIKALKLYLNKYRGLNLVHASERLAEKHNIIISHETLRNWLIKSGDWKVNVNKKDTITQNKQENYTRENTVHTKKNNGKDKKNGNSSSLNNRTNVSNENYEENVQVRYPRRKYVPAPEHPWRKPIFRKYADKYRNEI